MITLFLILAAAVVIGLPLLVLCWAALLLVFGKYAMLCVMTLALFATCGVKGLAIGAILYVGARLFGFTFGPRSGQP
jgi:hypothetical protein